MGPIINEEEKVESKEFEGLKKHWNKHKKKYIIGGLAALAFGLGYHFGNKGNSRHTYTRLLKDGVKGAVEDGMRSVVEEGMHDVVMDGMQVVVNDAVKRNVKNVVEDVVGSTVKKAIKESAVTIIKEIKNVEPEPLKNKDVDDLQKFMKHITDLDGGMKIFYDSDKNTYTIKHGI